MGEELQLQMKFVSQREKFDKTKKNKNDDLKSGTDTPQEIDFARKLHNATSPTNDKKN
jgi:hypothetical protein